MDIPALAAGLTSTPVVPPKRGDAETEPSGRSGEKAKETSGTSELTADQKRKVAELRKIDRATRAHEAAHTAAGGGLVTHGATYTYTTGPDGKRYAVAGEVGIDVSAEQSPEATIRKMQRVRAAALAPADPSSQDRAVAARAQATASAASAELARGRGGSAEEEEKASGEASATRDLPSRPRIDLFA